MDSLNNPPNKRANTLIQLIVGPIFLALGIYVVFIQKAPLIFLLVALLGLMIIANGLWWWRKTKFFERLVALTISLLFFTVAYFTLDKKITVTSNLSGFNFLESFFGKGEIGSDAARYTLFIAFVFGGLFPHLFLHFKSFLKIIGTVKGIIILYGATSFVMIIFPVIYTILFEKDKNSLPIFYTWFVASIIILGVYLSGRKFLK